MSSGWSLAHSQDEYDPSSFPESSGPSAGGWGEWRQYDDDTANFTPPVEEKQRDAVIFLLDFTRPMHQPQHADSTAPTSFHLAVKALLTFAKQKIIQSGGDDLLGVLLMGTTRQAANNNNFPHLHKYLPLSHPTAAVIKQLHRLHDDSVVADVGVGGVDGIDLFNALWSTQAMFTEANTASKTSASTLLRSIKRVFVMTCNDRPYRDESERQRALVKCRDLSEQETTIELFRFNGLDHKFDAHTFWREALVYDHDSDRPEQLDVKLEGNWEELRSLVLRKVSKKRAMGSIHWQLGHNVQLSVRLFCLYLEAKKEAPVFVERKSNMRLTAETRHIDTSDGQYVEKYQMRRYFPYGEFKAFITDDEMKAIKDLGEPGLQLMGFKPLDSLRNEHNYRPSYFIYPDDTSVRGSTRSFSALLSAMLELQQLAICRLIARRGSLLRFVALLPQAEKVDEAGRLVVAGGMHMVFLPYADDMRDLRLERREEQQQDGEEEQKDSLDEQLKGKARAVIAKMAIRDYDPSSIFNPALQRHYAGLQAMALQEALDEEELEDELQPDTDKVQSFAAFYDAFNELAFTAPGDKRRAGAAGRGGGGAAGGDVKRVKREPAAVSDDEYNAVDWEALKESGEWKKVTVAQLKIYLKRHKLPVSGTKDELIRRIEAHQPD